MKNRVVTILVLLVVFNFAAGLLVFFFNTVVKSLRLDQLSTTHQYSVIAIALISFIFIANYLIHLYFIQRQKIVLQNLKQSDYQLIRNIRLRQGGDFNFRLNRADLIITDRQLIIFLYNYNLNGLIKQAQPILLIHHPSINPSAQESAMFCN